MRFASLSAAVLATTCAVPGCFGGRAKHGDGGTGGAAGDAGVALPTAEAAWLQRLGTGPAQTARVCARGAADPIARALCASPAPALASLEDLHRAVGLGTPGTERRAAAATHSLGLAARTVSPVNPRTFVFSTTPLDVQKLAAVAFSRGEPFVEMVGYDPAAADFNFYLLQFRPRCAGTAAGCSSTDLLTAAIERDWTDWTLYADTDLEDTGLDCLSCHRPDGAGAPKRLLMRQLAPPWMHWGDFRGQSGTIVCHDQDGNELPVPADIHAEGLDVVAAIEGPNGRHGGVPIAELTKAASGYDFSSFLFYTVGLIDGAGDVPCEPPFCPFTEHRPFDSQAVLCDRVLRGAADVAGGTWQRYRADALAQGLPVPYFGPDVLDATSGAEARADLGAYLRARAAQPAFDVAAELLDAGAMRAVGVTVTDADDPPAILRQMCVRCHNAGTPAHLARARFRADDLDALDATGAAKVIERLSQPRTSADLMPPLRAGELSPAAIARVSAFLQQRR